MCCCYTMVQRGTCCTEYAEAKFRQDTGGPTSSKIRGFEEVSAELGRRDLWKAMMDLHPDLLLQITNNTKWWKHEVIDRFDLIHDDACSLSMWDPVVSCTVWRGKTQSNYCSTFALTFNCLHIQHHHAHIFLHPFVEVWQSP